MAYSHKSFSSKYGSTDHKPSIRKCNQFERVAFRRHQSSYKAQVGFRKRFVEFDLNLIRIRNLQIESELMKFDLVRIELNLNRIRIDRIRIELSQIESNLKMISKKFLFWKFVRPCVTQLFNFRENKNFLFWKFV